MTKMKLLAACLCTVMTLSSIAQSLEKDRIEFAWKNMKNMVVKSVQQMPEEHWDFTPVEGLRTFKDQIKHVTTSNRFFASSLVGASADVKAANDKTLSAEVASKEDIIKDLEESFDYAIKVITGIDDFTPQINFFGQVLTRTELLMQMEHHLHREHGKTTVYMRMKGIAPAKSTSWLM